MALAVYSQRGEVIDYPNSGNATIAAGTVVDIGSRIGIASADIEPGMTGAIHVSGVFEIPKSGTAAFALGDEVSFDGTGIIAAADGKPSAGYVVEASEESDTTVTVKLPG